MKKKKMKDQEEAIQDYIDKTTENKENTNNPNNNNKEKSEDSDSERSTEHSSDGLAEENTASDKVVPDVKALEEKLAEVQDKYIRLSAEFDNYRKRTLREKMELSKYCLIYTSDAADDLTRVDLGGRRII